MVSLLLAALLTVSAASPLSAQNMSRAAAVVNDEVISVLDLVMRTRLAMLSAGLNDSPETRERLQQQVLRALIDEKLQLQEANRLDISVATNEIDAALDQIAQQNGMRRDQFLAAMQERGLLPNALIDQIRASLAWRTLVSRRLRPTVEISDDEVDELVARVQAESGNQELRISEIFLSVDNVLQEEEVEATAQRLVDQLRDGADFAALARQFSQSATASVGGDLGWVREGQLVPEVAQAVRQLRTGQLSRPIKTFGGYYIVALLDMRQQSVGDAQLRLKQVLFAVQPGAPRNAVQQAIAAAAEAKNRIDGCESVDAVSRVMGSPGSGDLGLVKLSDLPDGLQRIVSNLAIGQPSDPVQLSGGVGILVVCEREDGTVDRDRIYESLLSQRLNLLARRYMRDLRRQANVDLRL
ncbi:MAG: peptidylprolyl isomerase [Kiloniellales bacterium]|nr:peptidylprolyl isomerase [Kiloniellales bacterium]